MGAVTKSSLAEKPKAAHWTHENTQKLLSLFDANASQLELAAAFPELKWSQIFNEIRKHRGLARFTPIYLRKNETYNDYLASGGRKGKATPSLWRPEEETLLREMVKNGATQEQIMQQFPFRRWIQLQHRIGILCGKGPRVPLSGIS